MASRFAPLSRLSLASFAALGLGCSAPLPTPVAPPTDAAVVTPLAAAQPASEAPAAPQAGETQDKSRELVGRLDLTGREGQAFTVQAYVLGRPDVVIAATEGNLISSGAGNLISSGAGNLISSGAGNLISSGAGNLISSGAGNLISSGAGNLTSAEFSLALPAELGSGAPIRVVAVTEGLTLASLGTTPAALSIQAAARPFELNAATTIAYALLRERVEAAGLKGWDGTHAVDPDLLRESLDANHSLVEVARDRLSPGHTTAHDTSVAEALMAGLGKDGLGVLPAQTTDDVLALSPELKTAYTAALSTFAALGLGAVPAAPAGGGGGGGKSSSPTATPGVAVGLVGGKVVGTGATVIPTIIAP